MYKVGGGLIPLPLPPPPSVYNNPPSTEGGLFRWGVCSSGAEVSVGGGGFRWGRVVGSRGGVVTCGGGGCSGGGVSGGGFSEGAFIGGREGVGEQRGKR